jgi:hypothetical protein
MPSNARTQAACDKAARPFVWQDYDPRAGTVSHDWSLDRKVAKARAEMGEDRWQQLSKEWE